MTDNGSSSYALDSGALRKEFPILFRQVHGRPLVYLDNAATTQKPRAVIQALVDYYEGCNANVHRGVHSLSQEATERMEAARARVARFIGEGDPATVVFTKNATESINLVAYAWARKRLKPGDEILLTEMEHHSNLVPWQLIAQETGAVLRFIPVTGRDGFLDLSSLDRLLCLKTKMLALTHMSNVLGTINPVRALTDKAHAVGARVLVDGAQSAPHLALNVQRLGADFFVFSAHKMLGPTGIGVLWARREILEEMEPFLGGGDMIQSVWKDHSTWNDLPFKFEAGTPPIAEAIAFGAAVDYLEKIGMDRIRSHEMELTGYAMKQLKERFPDIVLHGPPDPALRGGVVSFEVPGVHAHDVGTILDREGVAIRAGHHCCQVLMKKFNIPGSARASFYLYNTREDVDAFLSALEEVEKLFHLKTS